MKNVLLTGGTGIIGSVLTKKLIDKGYTPVVLSTSTSNRKAGIYKWNPRKKTHSLLPYDNFYGIINLAGASIAETKWNTKGKKEILESRVNSTLYLKDIIESFSKPPAQIISVSAIGYYGLFNDNIKNETSPPGKDFAAQVCVQWEEVATKLQNSISQLSILRLGIVMSKTGGFFKKIRNLAKWKIASPIGNGKQPVCWIHIEDTTDLIIDILENRIPPDTYNLVANCNTNKEVTKNIAFNNGQKFLRPAIPGIFIRMIFGKKGELFTSSCSIDSDKLKKAGFKFKYSNIDDAIKNLSS